MRGFVLLLSTFAAALAALAWKLPPEPLWADSERPDPRQWALSGDGKMAAALSHTSRVGKLRVVFAETGNLFRNVAFDWTWRDDVLDALPDRRAKPDAAVPRLLVNADGSLAAVVVPNGPATVVDIADDKFRQRYPAKDDRTAILDLAFRDDDVLLLLVRRGQAAPELLAWDFKDDAVAWRRPGSAAFAWTPDRQAFVLDAATKRTVALDPKSGAELPNVAPPPGLVPALPPPPGEVAAGSDHRRRGIAGRNGNGEPRFELHSVPSTRDWTRAAGFALLPTALAALWAWRRGWLTFAFDRQEPSP